MKTKRVAILVCTLLSAVSIGRVSADDYNEHVAPLFNKYCVSCHNDDDVEGGLSLESYQSMQKGGDTGPAILPNDSASSQIVRRITGEVEPVMPPDEMEGPNESELAALTAWINGGAVGPKGEAPDRTQLIVPRLQPSDQKAAITAMAWSPGGEHLAVARFQSIELIDPATGVPSLEFADLPGKVNSLEFSSDGQWLIAASGVTGLYGLAVAWDVETGEEIARLKDHRDSLYSATINQQKTHIATAGYDKKIIIWSVNEGTKTRELVGHTQPIYSLAFDPSGKILTSASGDETIKVWNVESGTRLDTLGQPLGEQYVTRFSPDGSIVLGGGVDNRIRVWQLVSRNEPAINPIRIARFAHEGAITHLEFSADGSRLVSASEDRTIKIWNTNEWAEIQILEALDETISALALAPNGSQLFVGMMDGALQSIDLDTTRSLATQGGGTSVKPFLPDAADMAEVSESEPNNDVETAMELTVPTVVTGLIHATSEKSSSDTDLYRFDATQGEQWIIEVVASRDGSPLDSFVEVLDASGQPIERVLLQAVRDSYFTFRGKDSNTSDDFRVHNWEEMELNEYLYSNGEVNRLWLYPRGPDSGFKVYPGKGVRHGFFDTTPLAHALQEPCYIVVPHPPGTELIPNGLPVFPIYYENDDESKRKSGTDSKVNFVAPETGSYVIRVSDTRGFSGESFHYKLQVRAPKPDFKVTIGGANPTIGPGSGREFSVRAERFDGFEGEIEVQIDGVPPGFHVTSPITIQAGQYEAFGMIWTDENAPAPNPMNEATSKVTATAIIADQEISHDVNSLGKIQLGDPDPVRVHLSRVEGEGDSVETNSGPLVLDIEPGETIMARVSVERNGHEGLVSFGKDDSGRNLPHGVYVDNIGLNGLMIVAGQNERIFFITAADWVPEQERLFHLRAEGQGKAAAAPVMLRVRSSK